MAKLYNMFWPAVWISVFLGEMYFLYGILTHFLWVSGYLHG